MKGTADNSFTISLNDGIARDYWKNYEVTLQELQQIFEDPAGLVRQDLKAVIYRDDHKKIHNIKRSDYQRLSDKKKKERKNNQAVIFGGSLIADGSRGDENIKDRCLINLDCDHVTPEEAAAIIKNARSLNCWMKIYPTISCSAEDPRFRIMIPLSTPADVESWKNVTGILMKKIAGDIDRKSRKSEASGNYPYIIDPKSFNPPSQAMFLEAHFKDDSEMDPYRIGVYDQPVLDWKAVLNDNLSMLPEIRERLQAMKPDTKKKETKEYHNKNTAYTRKLFTSAADMSDEQRAKLRKAAGYLRVHGVPIRSATIDDGHVRIGIVCPWCQEHTADSGNTETVILIHPDNGPPGFDCKHSHCAGRGWSDVLRHFGNSHGLTFITVPEGDQDPLSAVLPAEVSDRERRAYIGESVVVVQTGSVEGSDKMTPETWEIMKQLYEVAYRRRFLSIPAGWSGPEDWGRFFDDFIDKGPWKWAPWLKLHKPTNADKGVYPTGLREGPLSEALANNSDYLILNGGDHPIAYFYDNRGIYAYAYSITEKLKAFMPSHLWSASVFGQSQKLFLADTTKQVSFDNLNANEQLINLKNGLLDVRTLASDQGLKMIPHDPEHLFTSQLSFEYDPTAECPLWLSFIDDCCRDQAGRIDEQLRDLIQELFGYTLSNFFGYRLKAAVFLFSRRGNTGKSVILSVLRGMIGTDNSVSISLRALGGTGGESRWITSSMYGKRLTVCPDEGGAVKMESDERFKSLTGADPVAAERKGADLFTFVYPGIIWTAGNSLPVFRGKGDHLIDRMIIIPFENTIPEDQRDPELSDKLRAEYPGIFNWAMEGLKRVTDDNGKFKGISSLTQSDKRKTATESYRSQSDTLYAFFRFATVPDTSKGSRIKKAEFENDYKAFCTAADFIQVNKKNVKDRMASYGIECKRGRNTTYYKNMKWSDLWFEVKSRCTFSNGQLDPMKVRDFLEDNIDLDLYAEDQD